MPPNPRDKSRNKSEFFAVRGPWPQTGAFRSLAEPLGDLGLPETQQVEVCTHRSPPVTSCFCLVTQEVIVAWGGEPACLLFLLTRGGPLRGQQRRALQKVQTAHEVKNLPPLPACNSCYYRPSLGEGMVKGSLKKTPSKVPPEWQLPVMWSRLSE